ncbi:response regulator [Clostridium estertheticum]|uniref:Stage 0 sporulation protein A homolog n=1 Tax=Clostridium estertheticum TaxID=238834 RepID=A0A5N7IRW1_9CLOT|nr:response regulator [Clostridium estertheticum]MPQ33006.1 response regulator [Clostridium estertheticum]MPQ63664.1 response regulator [Clostridium estertheticum]
MGNKIIKVLIVDDEHLVRTLLRRCIDWNSIGMEIIGEATSGEDAIELVNKYQPDLVFTDICMPGTDGIEFADFVMKSYSNVKIVVISGYDDFKYAQRGIRAGIKEYLLKPIDDEVVLKTALKMKVEIEEEREVMSENNIIKKQFIENLPFLEERLFNRLIHPNINIVEVERQMDYLNFKFGHENFQLAVIEIILGNEDNYTKKEKIYDTKIVDKLEEYFLKYTDTYIFFDDNYNIAIINNGDEISFKNALENLEGNILKRVKWNYSVGIGTTKYKIENIEKSYNEAVTALNYRTILGKDTVIKYDDISFKKETVKNTIIKIDDKLELYFLAGSGEMIQKTIDDIFKNKDVIINTSINKVKEYAFSYVSTIFEALKELNIDIKELHSGKFDIYNDIYKLDTIPDIKKYIIEMSYDAIKVISYHKNRKSNKLIDNITKYLKLNLGNSELSLSKVAQIFFINPSYLSRMFKKEMEVNFMEYIVKLRIDKAIMLLNSTDLKAYEIGDKVGIADPSYFSTSFKKYTGISVSEYRKVKH